MYRWPTDKELWDWGNMQARIAGITRQEWQAQQQQDAASASAGAVQK